MERKNAIFLRIKSYLLSNDALDRLKLKHFSPKSAFKELNFLPLREQHGKLQKCGWRNKILEINLIFIVTFEANNFPFKIKLLQEFCSCITAICSVINCAVINTDFDIRRPPATFCTAQLRF